jgi:hypothetical protein
MPNYTVEEIIDIAKLSQTYATIDIQRKGLNAGGIDRKLPRKLYCIRKNVEWLFDLEPDDDTLIHTSNYLYALCAPYNIQAAEVIGAGAGGGSVAPIVGPALPEPIEFNVDGSSFITTGSSSKIFPAEWEGFNLLFVRNEIPQGTLDLGQDYYSWDRDTRTFTLFGPPTNNGAAIVGEHFFIMPIG